MKRKAFTFVEVLVAMVVVAVLLPVTMKGLSSAMSLGSHADRRSEAAMLGQGVMETLITTGQWQAGPLAGDFGVDRSGFRWQAAANAWPNSSAVRQLDVTVYWNSNQQERSVTLSTLVNEGSGL